jgi:hypothetical protein
MGPTTFKKNNILVSKVQIESNTIMVKDFYTPFSPKIVNPDKILRKLRIS